MHTGLIVIRPATSGDIADIWRLLHCEGRDMPDEAITDRLANLYVLYQGVKLIGVHCDRRKGGEAAWTCVHPLYSQGAVEEIMAGAVNGLVNDDFHRQCGVNAWISKLIKKPSSRFISSSKSRSDIFC